MNLLGAYFTGKVGKVVGDTCKGQHTIKSLPEVVRHPSPTQTASLTAFAKLNRISSTIAKNWWPYTGLKDNQMLKHNAVAHLLKPLIEKHATNWKNINQVAPECPYCHFSIAAYLESQGQIHLAFAPDNGTAAPPRTAYCLIIFDNAGITHHHQEGILPINELYAPMQAEPADQLHAILLLSEQKSEKYTLKYADYIKITHLQTQNTTQNAPITTTIPQTPLKNTPQSQNQATED
jgi:hypothetical protein